MKIKNSMRLAAWLAVFALLMLSAAAATLDEMYENGVVSDGNVRFGDARDGVVSDVSGPMPGPISSTPVRSSAPQASAVSRGTQLSMRKFCPMPLLKRNPWRRSSVCMSFRLHRSIPVPPDFFNAAIFFGSRRSRGKKWHKIKV